MRETEANEEEEENEEERTDCIVLVQLLLDHSPTSSLSLSLTLSAVHFCNLSHSLSHTLQLSVLTAPS